MLILHKILPFFVMPMGAGLLLILAGLAFRRRLVIGVGVVLLWFFSTPLVATSLVSSLEGTPGRIPLSQVEQADGVVVLDRKSVV